MRLYLLAGLMLTVIGAIGQGLSGTVMGKLIDGKQEPLVFANVVWKDTRSGTLTDEQGKFKIGIPPEAQLLVVYYIGFESDTIVYSGQQEINVVLKQLDTGGNDIIIEGQRSSTFINSRDPQLFQVLNERGKF